MDEVIPLDGGRSFGILTRASGSRRGKAVVLLNAGLIHRIGPFRLHVHLARKLAMHGFDVLRFDLPRVGDAPAGSHATEQAAIREAMDVLQAATGSGEFVVGGICSGADQGWITAVSDRRVSGLFLMDGMAVKNLWFRLGQLGLLLKRPVSTWPGMAVRFLRSEKQDAPGVADFRNWPDQAAFKEQLAGMLERGVKILAIYTGGISYYLLHRRQLDATFGASRGHPCLDVEYWPAVDHILFSPLDRKRTVERICAWLLAA